MLHVKLASQAAKLSRRLYASLPWGYRIARLLLKLSVDTASAFGRAYYLLLLAGGVKGLPDVRGEPAENFQGNLRDSKFKRMLERKVPSNYGKDFGHMLWATMQRQFGDPKLVDEAMMDVMLKVFDPDRFKLRVVTLREAHKLAFEAVRNRIIDLTRKGGKERPTLMREDEGTVVPLDLEDPRAWAGMEDLISVSDLRRMQPDLRRIDREHPERATDWIDAQMEGLSNVELAREWGVSPSAAGQWIKRYLPQIKKVIQQHYPQAVAV